MYKHLPRLSALLLLLALAVLLADGSGPVAAQGTGSISGRVIHDLNGDGDADGGEPGLSGWLVELESYNTDEPLTGEATTERKGRYSFEGLPPGEYDISLPCEGQPSLWGGTPTEYTGYSVTLEPGEDFEDLDFFVIPINAPPSRRHTGSIEGRLVLDEDRDGVAEAHEPGVGGWEVETYLADEEPVCFSEGERTALSEPDGRFRFSDLVPGSYWVSLDISDKAPLGKWALDAPGMTMNTGDYEWFELSSVEVPEDGSGSIAIGVIALEGSGSISGAIYYDLNENGVRDSDEPLVRGTCWIGLSYRTVKGYSGVGPVLQQCPAEGRYEFSGLAAGDYMVGVIFGPGPPINPPGGSDGIPDFLLTLGEGEQRADVDFGFAALPPESTEEPALEPTLMPQPTPEPATPVPPPPSAAMAPPATGSGAPSAGGAPWPVCATAVLLVVGALALSGSVLVASRRADQL